MLSTDAEEQFQKNNNEKEKYRRILYKNSMEEHKK